VVQDGRHDVREIHRVLGPGAGLAAGQGEKPVEGALAVFDGGLDVPGHREQFPGVRPAVERDVDRGPHRRQRRTQLVGRVRGEQALALQHPVALTDALLDPVQHAVDRPGQGREFVRGRGDRHPFGQVLHREAASGRRDGPDRPQHAAGDEPAEYAGQHDHDGERDRGLGQELRQRGLSQFLADPRQRRQPAGAGTAPVDDHDREPPPQGPVHQQVRERRENDAGGKDHARVQQGEPAACGQVRAHELIR
jgi:hypothetical protein